MTTSEGTSGPRPFDTLGARRRLEGAAGAPYYYRLSSLAEQGIADLSRMPVTVKIFVENLLRHCAGDQSIVDDTIALAHWQPQPTEPRPVGFWPARVLLQDFTGVPCVVDLAAMRAAAVRLGGDPKQINPLVPADLVIDHSVQIDRYGSTFAFGFNVEQEYARNRERYALLRWAQQAFDNFRVVPPDNGIVHQVNLEYLARVVQARQHDGELVAYPDTLVGTDSHTTMINGLGVLGWGVGGIEAEAVLVGQPLEITTPIVVGLRIHGDLREGTTATDVVLSVTELLRKHGVVEKFVEFTGPGLRYLSLQDRATLSNMAPEYGATAALFPVDDETLRYLRLTGRDDDLVSLIERYTKEQGMFRTNDATEPFFSELVELDLGTIEPSLAGPRRPEDRVALPDVPRSFRDAFASVAPPAVKATPDDLPAPGRAATAVAEPGAVAPVEVEIGAERVALEDGSVVIASITSCTNTSNPMVMVGAGLLAKRAVERGLKVRPSVKTSMAPGSKVVDNYLARAGLMPYLEALGFHVVGYGCATCIGNSGPLAEPVADAIQSNNLSVAAVLSGNRNFEGRIHPQVRAAYLASPPLVVAYALAGTVNVDLAHDPLSVDPNNQPVYLHDIWPSLDEIRTTIDKSLTPEMYRQEYAGIFVGDERWRLLPVPPGELYAWDPDSTYVREPPYFEGLTPEPPPVGDIVDARVLALLGDSVTTDHISPAGAIPKESPAGQYLIERGVTPKEFNSYGARRGNHEVMVRGTFGNIRLRNLLVPGREGDWTVHFPTDEVLRIYQASMLYQRENTPLIVIAGKNYGSGSSRDWAAKGPMLLGVKAVIAQTFERIHRSNLIGMGILPLQFKPGESAQSLGLDGREQYSIGGIAGALEPRQELHVTAHRDDGTEITFTVDSLLRTPLEITYYQNGGILPTVLRQLLKENLGN